jgi:hypothetical protein
MGKAYNILFGKHEGNTDARRILNGPYRNRI